MPACRKGPVTVRCPNGHENPENYQYCGECGALLSATGSASVPAVTQPLGSTPVAQFQIPPANRPQAQSDELLGPATGPSSSRRYFWVILGVVGTVISIVVIIVLIEHLTSNENSPKSSPSYRGPVSGSEDEWLDAICATGTFVDAGGDLPDAAQGTGFCKARFGQGSISIGKYDSDFKMRNALAQTAKTYYVSGIESDGTVIVFAVDTSQLALKPLTKFGFTINAVRH